MRASFPQGKLGKQDAKRIAAFAYYDFRPGKIKCDEKSGA